MQILAFDFGTKKIGVAVGQTITKSSSPLAVVFNKDNYASYFSRSIMPYSKEKNNYSFKQVCVIPFTRSGIIKYMKLKPTKLEKIESIENQKQS